MRTCGMQRIRMYLHIRFVLLKERQCLLNILMELLHISMLLQYNQKIRWYQVL